jgi:hypothetical protein
MTFRNYIASPRYTVDAEWQSTPRVVGHLRRLADSRESSIVPRYDAVALTEALRLDSKPALNGVARRVVATYAIPYDILIRGIRRRARRP